MKRNLLIFGAGQYGILAKEIAESMNLFKKIDFLDDNSTSAIGKTNEFAKFLKDYKYAFVAIGNNEIRLSKINEIEESGFEVVSLISPDAYVSKSAVIGKGCIVEPKAIVQANSIVEKGCLLCSGVVVKHNAVVAEGCYLDCNCVIMPDVKARSKSKIEACTIFCKSE